MIALNSSVGIASILVILGLGVAVTLVSLAYYTEYRMTLDHVQNTHLTKTAYFAGFYHSLLIVPLLLMY
ncbi:hypothetical protein C451_03944 [Halococcus thailandensis JCM 13552]|uniref:Uncharacterized protein n=1 Tax=Halococcus thailandensis JCM 13552 TaxID=1227457 RepID=M0NDV3_9EURY|nr:hypothetical protein C451_03944 [Halococcus thailandensis JCM 13552]